ncbi:MsnO8 family LLM class oxidoreductase [Devosia sp.]|uniref:MsnO8 family LLM class oxidoreductase n=1 Tax=Devosia sp. TaxID=1871048 RepID=UPI003F706AF5
MSYRLSLLDKSPIAKGETAHEALQRTLALAQAAERLGFHRFWVAEHHDTAELASSAPELVIAWLLAGTRRIRIGSGGVMLQHYSPYKVAESFNTLAAIAPGRVDLGVGKAPGGLPFSTKALQSEREAGRKLEFDRLLGDLTTFLDGTQGSDRAKATPAPATAPERFLLGASVDSAELAAGQGWGFVFARHLNGDEALLAASVERYRQLTGRPPVVAVAAILSRDGSEARAQGDKFRPLKLHIAGRQSVTVGSEEQAREFARQAGVVDYRTEPATPSIVTGAPRDLLNELDRLSDRLGIAEFIVDLFNQGDSRLEAVELLAAAHAAVGRVAIPA